MDLPSISRIITKGALNFHEIRKQFSSAIPDKEEKYKKQKNDTNNQKRESNPQKLIDTISQKSTSSLKEWLLTIEEVKYFYDKTHIPPQYIFYFLVSFLTIIIINYFSRAFTLVVGVIYPVHRSIHTLIRLNIYDNKKKYKIKEEDEKKKKIAQKKMKSWLEYWIVFFLFYNIETIFSSFLQKIPMYLFYKVIFLAVLILPWYRGAHYIYRSYIKEAFKAYEGALYNFSLAVMEKIKEEIFVDNPKNIKNNSSDDENYEGDSADNELDSDVSTEKENIDDKKKVNVKNIISVKKKNFEESKSNKKYNNLGSYSIKYSKTKK